MTASGLSRRAALALGASSLLARKARAQSSTVRIGVLNDQSGVYRDGSGQTSVICARQALEDLAPQLANANIKVEILTGDHQNKPDVGLNIARQWFDQEGVDMIIDVPTTSIALAVNAAVVAAMKAEPAEDDCYGRTVIRADGRAMVTPYLFQLKSPAQSKGEWDLFDVIGSMSPDETAPSASNCKLVKT